MEIWVVSETRIHAEIQGNYRVGVEMREGSFPKPAKILIHQRMKSNHRWDIFTQLGPFLCHYITF